MSDTYRGESGEDITEETIAGLADEAEAGYDVEDLRRSGRPRMGSAPARVVPVRLDPELAKALRDRADHDHANVSQVIREALLAYLKKSA